MVVVKLDLWRWLKRPIDGGRAFRGKPLFGPNKTWRGVVFMIAAPALLGAAQGGLGGPWADASGAACMDFARVVGVAAGDASRLACAAAYTLVNAVFGLGYAVGELRHPVRLAALARVIATSN